MNTDVYSWRLPRSLKQRLEKAAVDRERSLAQLLREITEEWLASSPAADEEALMEQARQRAMTAAGSISGGDPRRSERAGRAVRAKLTREK